MVHHNYSIVDAAAVVIPTEDAYWDLIDDPAVTELYTPQTLHALDGREFGPGVVLATAG